MSTCSENLLKVQSQDIYTRDQVPVALKIGLEWQLVEPLKFVTHAYPSDPLQGKTQSVLTEMVSQRSLGPNPLPCSILGRTPDAC